MDKINKYRNISSKPHTLITCIIYNETQKNVLHYLNHQLELVKNIKNDFKKKIANNLIYKFKGYIEKEPNTIINKIFLVSKDVINDFQISKKNKKTLIEYDKKNIYYKTSDKFMIDYIINLFTDFKFFKVLELDKKNVTEYNINSTKKKLISKKKVNNQIELLEILNSNIDLVHGTSTFLKNLKSNVLSYNKRLCYDEILDEINKIVINKSHNELEELLSNLTNPDYEDKIIFGGKETKKYTELSMISKLYIHESIYRKFLRRYKDYINFTVIEIKRLKFGDISDILHNSYSNCIGILYYKKNF